ncbi:MAG TPA: acyl carrier protein [Isosphaeraceae bacterium]|jgi:acyl carrier protein
MNCPFCETPLAPGTKLCPHCGADATETPWTGQGPSSGPPPYGAYPAPTSNLAVISLITGILSWFVLPVVGALAAVITGHMARAEIRARRGQLAGDGFAVVGLVLGYLHLVVLVVILLVVLAVFGAFATWIIRSSPRVATPPPPKAVVAQPAPARTAPEDVAARVIEIVSQQMEVPRDRVTPATSLADDLKADDLDQIELVMELEEQFDITIPDEEAEGIRTVGQWIDLVKSKLAPVAQPRAEPERPPSPEPGPHSLRRPPDARPTPRWARTGLDPAGRSRAA